MKCLASLRRLTAIALALIGALPAARAQEGNALPIHDLTDREVTEAELLKILLPKDAGLGQARGMGLASPKPRCRLTSRGMGIAPRARPVSEAAALHIQFAFNSAELLSAASRNLDVVGSTLSNSSLAAYCFRIEGHADSVGSNEYNQKLSQKRAQSVARYLASHFLIDPNQLEIIGLGETRPLADNDTEEGRHRNRRVQIVTLDTDDATP
jgi:outer membrane protein OmpA-like peptidoglycan-associated protein